MSQTSVKEFPERKCSLDVVGKQCFGEYPFNVLPTQCMPIFFAMYAHVCSSRTDRSLNSQ